MSKVLMEDLSIFAKARNAEILGFDEGEKTKIGFYTYKEKFVNVKLANGEVKKMRVLIPDWDMSSEYLVEYFKF